MNINDIQRRLQQFAQERDWEQFHSPKNLVMALSTEVGELGELFQWLTEQQSIDLSQDPKKKARLEEEIADIAIYLIRLSHKTGVDLETAINRKIDRNAEKYPVHLAKGNARKYNELT